MIKVHNTIIIHISGLHNFGPTGNRTTLFPEFVRGRLISSLEEVGSALAPLWHKHFTHSKTLHGSEFSLMHCRGHFSNSTLRMIDKGDLGKMSNRSRNWPTVFRVGAP